MPAEFALHRRLRRLALGQLLDGLGERLDHLARLEPAQIATLRLRAVHRHGLRQVLELGALVELRDHVLRLVLGLHEDVAGLELVLRHLGDTRVVLGLEFGLARRLVLHVLLGEGREEDVGAVEIQAGLRLGIVGQALLLRFLSTDLGTDQQINDLLFLLRVQILRLLAGLGLNENREFIGSNGLAVDSGNRRFRRGTGRSLGGRVARGEREQDRAGDGHLHRAGHHGVLCGALSWAFAR